MTIQLTSQAESSEGRVRSLRIRLQPRSAFLDVLASGDSAVCWRWQCVLARTALGTGGTSSPASVARRGFGFMLSDTIRVLAQSLIC